VLLHEFGEHLIFALQLRFQSFDLSLELRFDLGPASPFESLGSVLKEGSLPLIELAGVDLVLLAKIRHRLAFQQMQPKDFHFVFAAEMPTFGLTHNTATFLWASVR